LLIPEELVERVRNAADLVEVVSEHTRLKRAGKTFRGPCPLHGGEGPNFSVDPAKGFYKCFVCGEGGNVFTFLTKHLGMSFPDAVRDIADRVGIEIPDQREEKREDDPDAPLYELNRYAADWYRKRLWEGSDGQAAREYLDKRGITREAAERFGLGWAPSAWMAFREAAVKQGIPDSLLLEVGLAKDSQRSTEPYDAFRGRVIFPIEDLGGRVVAFGGRILGEADERTPKYLNSPESAIYHKGRVLYGLGWSRGAIRKEEAALVVEGYMDYVSLASHGVANAVAPLGTAMTEDQAHLIARYAPRAILLYDSDKAGLKATFRSGDELLRAGMEVLVATLPSGEDPDSLVRAKGPDALKRYLNDAVDVLERKIQILDRRDYFSSIKGTRQAIDTLLPTVRAASDEVLRGVYIGRISEKTGVPRETLEREVAVAPATRAETGDDRRKRDQGRRAQDRQATLRTDAHINAERTLLLLMLHDERWVEEAVRFVQPDDFSHPLYKVIFQGLLDAEGHRDSAGAWLERFAAEALPLLEELRGDPVVTTMVPADAFFRGCVMQIMERSYLFRLQEVNRRMMTADTDLQKTLFAEKQKLVQWAREAGLARRPGFMSAAVDPGGR
jgi:DNA primase